MLDDLDFIYMLERMTYSMQKKRVIDNIKHLKRRKGLTLPYVTKLYLLDCI